MSAERLQALDPLLHPDIDHFNDSLHKESDFVERFYQVIHTKIKAPFAISIDGPWGSGKTTVMKLLEAKCRVRGYPVFWFNPWKYSQSTDVVLAFLQALAKESRSLFQDIDHSKGKLFKVLLRVGMGAALKVGSQGTVSMDDVVKALKEEDLPFESCEDMIVAIEKEFKDLVNTISFEKYEHKPLIIFLDDFDCCLPQDAVKLLEALKNLFVTQDCQVIFICGIDARVAKNFVRDHYKVSDEFAINYFRKIFNLTVSMPHHDNPTIKKLLTDYIRRIYDDWDVRHIEALAKQVTFWGSCYEMSSIRKYLSVLHNYYLPQPLRSLYQRDTAGLKICPLCG